jgi:hypothetical protein
MGFPDAADDLKVNYGKIALECECGIDIHMQNKFACMRARIKEGCGNGGEACCV